MENYTSVYAQDMVRLEHSGVNYFNEVAKRNQIKELKARGLKIIGKGKDWIDWERSDGLRCRSWSYEWKGHSEYIG